MLDAQFQKMELMQMPTRLQQSLTTRTNARRQEGSATFIVNGQLCRKIHPKSSRDNKAIKRIIEERD